ncbi:MAG: nucleotide exchange factor GrpE [Clostridia bacterium]|nr:nucleotide exchange factor GrpE [Clostridia bacterium]
MAKKECKQPVENIEQPAAQVDNSELEALQAELQKVKQELEQKNDLLLRTAAEFDNFKKRETAAKEKLSGFVKGETIKALLPAVDNINRAMAADPESGDYAKGVAMTVKGLYDALKNMGLEEINPEGEEFDVNYHQAVMRVEDESVGANIVTQVLQMGYKIGDNVLRHAMVKVANCDL